MTSPGSSSPGHGRLPAVLGSLLVLVVLLAATAAWAVFRDPALSPATPARVLLLNAFPILCAAIAAWALTRRLGISLLVCGGGVWMLHLGNAIKLQNMGTPLLPSDASVLSQVLTNPDLFLPYVPKRLLALAASGALVLLALFIRFEPPTFPKWLAARIPAVAAGTFLAFAAFAGYPPVRAAYASQLGMKQRVSWNPADLYGKAGLVNGLGYYAAQASDSIGTADLAMLADFRQRHHDALQAKASTPLPTQLPDIVVIQVEALFDPGRIEGLDSAPWLNEWQRHASRGIHGSLVSPTFGGGTIRAEFEAMTGYPLQAFPAVQFPYYGLLVDGLPTLPNNLVQLGYHTRVVHPFKAAFWNRRIAMRALGFQELTFEEAFAGASRAGPYISDHALYQHLLDYDRSTAPQFVLAITMENHGPWTGDFRKGIDGQLPSLPAQMDELPEAARHELRRYLWHVQSGDRALGTLLDRLLARDRPTVVAVYGDHLPALKKVYPRVKFDDARPARPQPVPFMIVSNIGTPSRRIDRMPMSKLPSLLLEAAGLPLTGHFGVDAVLDDLPGRHPDRRNEQELRAHVAWRDFTGPPQSARTVRTAGAHP